MPLTGFARRVFTNSGAMAVSSASLFSQMCIRDRYMDVETRLENLKNQRTRLQQLQQQADNLSDLLEIERCV